MEKRYLISDSSHFERNKLSNVKKRTGVINDGWCFLSTHKLSDINSLWWNLLLHQSSTKLSETSWKPESAQTRRLRWAHAGGAHLVGPRLSASSRGSGPELRQPPPAQHQQVNQRPQPHQHRHGHRQPPAETLHFPVRGSRRRRPQPTRGPQTHIFPPRGARKRAHERVLWRSRENTASWSGLPPSSVGPCLSRAHTSPRARRLERFLGTPAQPRARASSQWGRARGSRTLWRVELHLPTEGHLLQVRRGARNHTTWCDQRQSRRKKEFKKKKIIALSPPTCTCTRRYLSCSHQ